MSKELKTGKYTILVEDLVKNDNDEFFWEVEEVEIEADIDVSIDDTDVDGELCKMGQLLSYYGDLSARLKAQFARKEEDREAYEAACDKLLRENFAVKVANDPKLKMPTETHLKKMIAGSDEYRGLTEEISVVRLHYYRVDNLLKALIKKADALNCLGYSQRQERKVY